MYEANTGLYVSISLSDEQKTHEKRDPENHLEYIE